MRSGQGIYTDELDYKLHTVKGTLILYVERKNKFKLNIDTEIIRTSQIKVLHFQNRCVKLYRQVLTNSTMVQPLNKSRKNAVNGFNFHNYPVHLVCTALVPNGQVGSSLLRSSLEDQNFKCF